LLSLPIHDPGNPGIVGRVIRERSDSGCNLVAGHPHAARTAPLELGRRPPPVRHPHRLANQAVTRVRQRVTRQVLGRRGTTRDPAWANRRRLLRARERLTEQQFTKMWEEILTQEATGELLAAWIAKEELRYLLALARMHAPRSEVSSRLFAFYDWCARADVPEVTTLAKTIEAWWPQILAFIDTGITNAGTEANNRLIKDAARIAFGFRNLDNQRRRVRLHCKRTTISQPMRG